jgi:DNA-directed RNA polymerase subunit H (RpoH/RPB5)
VEFNFQKEILELKQEISKKEIYIKELEDKLSEEIAVKKSEVMMNKELKQLIEKMELHHETLIKINENYSDKIAKLRLKLKQLIVDV